MDVVFIAPFGFEPKNTTGRRAMPMARALVSVGHRIRIVVPPYDDPKTYGDRWEDDGVEVFCLPRPRVSTAPVVGMPLVQFALARAAARLIKEWQPDLVHVFKPKAVSGLAQMLIFRNKHRPAIVLDMDDWEGRDGWSKNEDYSRFLVQIFEVQERMGMRYCDAFTTASCLLAERASQAADDRDVLHIPYGYDPVAYESWRHWVRTSESIDERKLGSRQAYMECLRSKVPQSRPVLYRDEEFFKAIYAQQKETRSDRDRQCHRFLFSPASEPDPRIVLIYTRFFDYGIAECVKLIQALATRVVNVHFVVLGAGKFRQEQDLADALRELGMEGRVSFAGWMPFEELDEVIAAAHVALLPLADTLANRAKCSPRYIDLMYAGVPVVTTPVGEARTYMTDGVNGYLSEDSSPEALVDATMRALEAQRYGDEDLRAVAQVRAAHKFSWTRLVEPLDGLYERAVHRVTSELT